MGDAYSTVIFLEWTNTAGLIIRTQRKRKWYISMEKVDSSCRLLMMLCRMKYLVHIFRTLCFFLNPIWASEGESRFMKLLLADLELSHLMLRREITEEVECCKEHCYAGTNLILWQQYIISQLQRSYKWCHGWIKVLFISPTAGYRNLSLVWTDESAIG